MASGVPSWWSVRGWSKRTWLVLFACVLAWGMLIGSCRWLVRVGDGARWSVFLGAGRLGLETYVDGAAELGMPPASGVQTWLYVEDADAAWPETQNTWDWITSDTPVYWLTRTTVRIWPWGVVLTGLTVWALVRERRLARERAGACVGCGYSLAGLEPGAVCPECGKAR